MELWTLEPFDSSDKLIHIYAGDVMVMVGYDDVDHDEAEMIARFIVAKQGEYEAWKAAQEEK